MHTFMETDREIYSMVILPLPLIQEGLLSVTSESMCTKYWLTVYESLPRKSLVRLTDHLNMTKAVDWEVKAQTKPNKISQLIRINIQNPNQK